MVNKKILSLILANGLIAGIISYNVTKNNLEYKQNIETNTFKAAPNLEENTEANDNTKPLVDSKTTKMSEKQKPKKQEQKKEEVKEEIKEKSPINYLSPKLLLKELSDNFDIEHKLDDYSILKYQDLAVNEQRVNGLIYSLPLNKYGEIEQFETDNHNIPSIKIKFNSSSYKDISKEELTRILEYNACILYTLVPDLDSITMEATSQTQVYARNYYENVLENFIKNDKEISKNVIAGHEQQKSIVEELKPSFILKAISNNFDIDNKLEDYAITKYENLKPNSKKIDELIKLLPLNKYGKITEYKNNNDEVPSIELEFEFTSPENLDTDKISKIFEYNSYILYTLIPELYNININCKDYNIAFGRDYYESIVREFLTNREEIN